MAAILNPIASYFDTDGSPLEGGYLYFGPPDGNPETTLQAVYWDEALTQPAAQPIRTSAGFPLRNGSPAIIYSDQDYSQTVRNVRRELVFYLPSSAILGSLAPLADGTAAAPSLRFLSSPTAGLFTPSLNHVGAAANGLEIWRWTPVGIGIGGTPTQPLDNFGTTRLRNTLTVSAGGADITGGLAVAGGVEVSTGGILVDAGGIDVTGNSVIDGNLEVTTGTFASRGFADNATAAAWNISAAGRLKNNGNTQISFSARRITSNQTTAGNIVFQDVAFAGGHNYGSAYDTTTGVFTVPASEAGVYEFDAVCPVDNTSGGDANPGMALRINGSDVIKPAFAIRTGVGTPYVFSIRLALSAGDTVSVRYDAAIASAVLVGSTFSGRQVG